MKKQNYQKIKKLSNLVKIITKLKSGGKKIVHCHGVFDLIHPGHIRHFTSAKKNGDFLIVSITADKYVKKGPGRPIFNQNLRAEVLAALTSIDFVTIVNFESAIEAINKLKPDFYVKGPDYKLRRKNINIPRNLDAEEDAVKKIGGKLIYSDDDIIFSSSKLINDYLSVYPARTKKFLDSFKSKYSQDLIIDKMIELKNLKILIVGDAIIDQYHYCLPLGKSSKEPIMVHQYISDESFLGGSLATANHLASLSANITLLTLLGKKQSFKGFIMRRLKSAISPIFFYSSNSHSIIKRRFLDANTNQKLFQITYLKDKPIPTDVEDKILHFLHENIKKYDLLIVNDFGHGMLTTKIIKLICAKAKYLTLNVQANSANYGFNVITKYPRADFVCIDEQEIRLATHDKYTDIRFLIKKIFKKMKCSFMIVTKGPKGSISYCQKEGFYETPALTEKVVDRVGAGDALFAITSPCIYADFNKEIVSFIGNIAGALQVQTLGNKYPIEFTQLLKFMTRLLK